jgi:hypothetical protein
MPDIQRAPCRKLHRGIVALLLLAGGKPIEVDAETREALERLGYAR